MSPIPAFVGPAANVGIGGARRGKVALDRRRETPKLLGQISRRVKSDESIPEDLRDGLGRDLVSRIKADPTVQDALGLLLNGSDVAAAQERLAQSIAALCQDLRSWPPDFDASRLGTIAAAHAAAAVSQVKATDREAAHTDAKQTHELLMDIKDAVLAPNEPDAGVGALLQGPIRQVGQEENFRAATELEADGAFQPAARTTLEIADALDAAHLSAAAITFRLSAARLLLSAGDAPTAQEILENLIWRYLNTPLHIAALSAIGALRQSGAEDWLVHGFEGLDGWPRLPWAAKWLDEAILNDARPDISERWRAARARIALLDEDHSRVLELSSPVGDMQAGVRLGLVLDRIDAVATAEGHSEADAEWAVLSDWVDTEAPALAAALAWRRRGCDLARRGDLDASRRAFRRAVSAQDGEPGGSADAAESMFSLWHVEGLLGGSYPDMTARGIAVNMRAGNPASDADRLLHQADSQRVTNDLLRAHDSYWKALALYHGAGLLDGVHLCANRLADVYSDSERPDSALQMALMSGSQPRARAAAAVLSPESVGAAIVAASAPWERAAVDAALATLGSVALSETVAAVVSRLLENSAAHDGASPSDPAAVALEALARVGLQVPEDTRPPVFERLRAGMQNVRLIDAGRACAVSLARAQRLGLVSAADDLIEMFLNATGADYLGPSDVADLVGDDAGRRRRIADAAADGNQRAARVLMQLSPDDDEHAAWQSVADQVARAGLNEQVRVEQDFGEGPQIAINMSARFDEAGKAGELASEDVRNALRAHTLGIAQDDELPESVRASAMRAVYFLIADLDGADLDEVSTVAQRLAAGEYAHNPIESPEVDPLSNVQMPSDTAGLLRLAALVVSAHVEQLYSGQTSATLASLLPSALVDRQPWLRAGAIGILTTLPDLEVEINAAAFLQDDADSVRTAALSAVQKREPEHLGHALERAREDPSYRVRTNALAIAHEMHDQAALTAIAAADPDCYLRLSATQALASR
jgi:hypothetical protein